MPGSKQNYVIDYIGTKFQQMYQTVLHVQLKQMSPPHLVYAVWGLQVKKGKMNNLKQQGFVGDLGEKCKVGQNI